jgi:hypothetical protein
MTGIESLAALWPQRRPSGPRAELRRVHAPYDGGADVNLAATAERDRLRERHADRLSVQPSGM